MDTYEPYPDARVQAAQWNDAFDTGKIASLIGWENIIQADGRLQVYNGRLWVNVLPHWWVSVNATHQLTVHTDDAFRRDYQKTAG